MNQYHCETCEYMRVTDKGMPPDCEKTKHWLTEGDRKLTKEVGCASHSEFICQGKKVMDVFVSLITSEMVYDDGDMYYKVNPEKYVEVLGRMVSDEPIPM